MKLPQFLADVISPQVIGLPLGQTQLSQVLEINGGIINNGFVGLFSTLLNAISPSCGVVNYQTSSATTITLTNLAGATVLLTAGAAVTVTLDNAVNVVNQIPLPSLGMKFPLTIATTASGTVAAPTVTNTGITLSGTTTVTSGGQRFYSGQITQLYTTTVQALTAGSTFTSIAQIGSTNLYTVTLGTNAVTTTVGNLLYLGVTAGNLPAGFYPIYSAGTTSVVVALPTSGTVWTATAATLTPPAVVPSTFAPLITLQGLYGMAAGVIVA